MKKTILLTFAGTLLAIGSVHAQIATWDVQGTGTSNNTGYAAGFVAPNADASGLGRTTVNWVNAGNSFNSNNWNLGAFDETTNYINFTITPDAGYEITYTSLQFAMNGSNTAPQQGRWGYRIGSGSFTTFDFTLTNPAPTSLQTWNFTDFTTDQVVEFRFWAFGSTSINGGTSATGGTVRIANISGNDLILNGSVALIPEPSTYALLALGLGALIFLRRRTSRA
ncbi:MAG: PEP-CTERM sorting domain-containing protein [Verrucomicrobiia bacterium]